MSEALYEKGRAWTELNLAALRHNARYLMGLLPEGCRLMPAVKADAYGHGAPAVTAELEAMGVSAFCVATASEGAELRESGVRGDILVLGYTHPGSFGLLSRYDLIQTVVDEDCAAALNSDGRGFRVHLAVDTGMHRLGVDWRDIDGICGIIHMEGLRVEGMFTHLCSDETRSPDDLEYTKAQAEALTEVAAQLRRRGCAEPKTHILSSYGLLNYPELGGAYARIGIALYGAVNVPELLPVLSVKARVASVRALSPGESAGYGRGFTARRDTVLATLSIGYADGLPGALSMGRGRVLINGAEAPIIGKICMDQTLVDATGVPNIRSGDEAVIIGRSGELEITALEIAERARTIPNEILSRLGSRLERVIIKDGAVSQ